MSTDTFRVATNGLVLIASPFVLGALVLLMCRVADRHLRRKVRLYDPPGWGLLRFAETCFSKETFSQVFESTLSDMQKEHIEALAASRPWKARIVLIRGYFSFWSAVVAQLPIPFIRRVYEVWKTTKIGH